MPKHAREQEAHPPRDKNKTKKEFRLDSNKIGFICAGVSNVGGYKRNDWYNPSCQLQTYCHLSKKEKLLAESLSRPIV